MKKDLLQLQKEWYKKLKEGGFSDIEYLDRHGNPQDLLKGGSKFSPVYEDQNSDELAELAYNDTEGYFREARELNHKGEFSSELDAKVWFLHSEGDSLRKIGAKVGFSHPKVLRIINKYKIKYCLKFSE